MQGMEIPATTHLCTACSNSIFLSASLSWEGQLLVTGHAQPATSQHLPTPGSAPHSWLGWLCLRPPSPSFLQPTA